jgi:hypothetical protein
MNESDHQYRIKDTQSLRWQLNGFCFSLAHVWIPIQYDDH